MMFRKRIVRHVDPVTGKRVPSTTPDAKRVEEKSSKWYVRVRLPDGRLIERPGYVSKEATRQLETRLLREAEEHSEGIGRYLAHEATPLRQHLDDYRAFQIADGVSPKQADQTVSRCRRMFDACGFTYIRDVRDDKAQQFLGDLRKPVPEDARQPKPGEKSKRMGRRKPAQGCSEQTLKHFVVAWRAFFRWMVDRQRTARNPLESLRRPEVKLVRHQRRALTQDEAERLLRTTRHSDRTFRGLSGEDRFALYLVALRSGLRKAELFSLTPEAFDLDAAVPVVNVDATITKNSEAASQPLHDDAVAILRNWLPSKPEGQPLWPGTWTDRASVMLRHDLDAAGIAYRTSDGVCDIHSLRHAYVTWLARSGASELLVQELARHSDPRLTKRHYTHLRVSDTAGAIRNQSPLSMGPQDDRQELRATGTDHAAADRTGLVALRVAPAADSRRSGNVTKVDDADTRRTPSDDQIHAPLCASKNPCMTGASDDSRERLTTADDARSPLWLKVHPAGLEPATFGSVDRCSIQLS